MALMFFAATDADAGEWFVFQEDKDKGEKAEARVRRLPPAERERIERKHFGKTRRVTYTEQGAVQDLNREKQAAAVRERANYSLLDTRGFEIVVGGEDAQRRLSEILGQDVKIGETLQVAPSDITNLHKLIGGRVELIAVTNSDALRQNARLAGYAPERFARALPLPALTVPLYLAFTPGSDPNRVQAYARTMQALQQEGVIDRLRRRYDIQSASR